MSDEKVEEMPAFPKEEFRELKAVLRRIKCRRDSVLIELNGHTNKVEGLAERMRQAQIAKKEKEKLLLPELEALKTSSEEIQAEIEALNEKHQAEIEALRA